MLTELCEYLKNWFCDDQDKHIGTITITGGEITARDDLYLLGDKQIEPVNGQYIRVIGSIFNDGVHCYPDFDMQDETFKGAVWLMRVPPAVLTLAEDIAAWKDKYMTLDSQYMSPYNSESFAGYSYSKSGAGANAAANGSGLDGWQAVFADRLSPWRKI